MRKSGIIIAFLCLSLAVCADIPANYYSTVNNKSGNAILTALNSIIDNHTVIGYSSLENYYTPIDFDSNGYLMDIYSTCNLVFSDGNKSQKKVCDAWNKEHTVPQSWFNESSPMKSDLHHVLPADARVNNFRGNEIYGETSSTAYIDNDPHALGHIGTSNFGSYSVGKVFEPDDEYKGDLARIYFYMVARYQKQSLNASNGAKVFTSGPTNLTDYARELFLKWHRQDPVSVKEINRNNGVYAVQKNRNPFVDYPYLVEYIWGEKSSEKLDMTQLVSSSDPSFVPGQSNGFQESADPFVRASVDKLTFPTLVTGQSDSRTFTLQLKRLTAPVTLAVSGTDAACFAVSPATITSSFSGDQIITVTYAPSSEAIHNAVLTVSTEGAEPVTVVLGGACATECTVTWLVDGQEYTIGNPTTSVAIGGKIAAIPAAPASCSDVSDHFVGWTRTLITDSVSQAPADLFTDESEAPVVASNIVFHACFARLTMTGSDTPATLSWAPKDASGWTSSGLAAKSGYSVLVLGASLTSPEVDLSALQSITVNMRTYGGATYKTVDVRCGNTLVCSLSASNNSLNDYTWTNTSILSGHGPLVFTSTSATSANGPGIAQITIKSEGTKYVYDMYRTSCTNPLPSSVEEISVPVPSFSKFIIDGRLYIECDNHFYNAQGQLVR